MCGIYMGEGMHVAEGVLAVRVIAIVNVATVDVDLRAGREMQRPVGRELHR